MDNKTKVKTMQIFSWLNYQVEGCTGQTMNVYTKYVLSLIFLLINLFFSKRKSVGYAQYYAYKTVLDPNTLRFMPKIIFRTKFTG